MEDDNTRQLAELVSEELFSLSGKRPHVIINNLSRTKLDANRDLEDAAFGHPDAEAAWKLFHESIDKAVNALPQRGLYIDVHGQCHKENWVELGYLLNGKQLDEKQFSASQSSIHKLAVHKSMQDEGDFVELLYGQQSLGGLLERAGLKTVPSPSHSSPEGGSYFNGGYNTRRYGTQSSASLDAIQIESPINERAPDKIYSYAKTLAKCLYDFLQMHYEVWQ